MMIVENGKILIPYVNIRQSISMLLLRVLCIEMIAALLMILYQSTLFTAITIDGIPDSIERYVAPFFLTVVAGKFLLTVYVVLQWLNEYYKITSTSIVHKKGIIFQNIEQYPLEHVQFVDVRQGILGRLFNYGTITLSDIRRNKYMDMYLIHNPRRYHQIIEDLIPGIDERTHILREHVFETVS